MSGDMKKPNRQSKTVRYLLLGLVLVCLLLMGLSLVTSRTSGPFGFLADITVIPLQKGINRVGGWFSDLGEDFETLQEVRGENEALKEQVDSLTIENGNLQQDRTELARLQELLQLDQNYADYEKVGAYVIGKDSGNWFSTFTIDKGSADGIRVDMNVMAGSGLVGIVTEVGPHWATVRSIIDNASNVSGMALTTSDLCIVEGSLEVEQTGQLYFDQMDNNDHEIQVGEEIVTSHISDKYLQGILIGYVSEIEVDSNNLTRHGYITPAVDFSNLQEVLVITTTKADQIADSGEN